MKAKTITVRLVQDQRIGKFWFEERKPKGIWKKIDTTEKACEGDSRGELMKVIESLKHECNRNKRRYGKEETLVLP